MPLTQQPVRASLIAVLSTTLVLAAGSLAAPGSASAAAERSDGARHAAARTVLEKVVGAFSTKRGDRSAPRRTALPRTDVTVLLRQLQVQRSSLSTSERRVADGFLSRAAVGEGCTGTVIVSAHFCVHYSTGFLNPNAATPAQAQLTSDTFEYVYDREVTALHYRAPLNDGDGLLDVSLQQLGDQGIYGFCQTDNATSHTSSASCAVDNDFSQAEFGPRSSPLSSLRVTAAHEFFHAVQFAYDADDDAWFLEGTAVWMEDIVYRTINDYLQYLPLSQVRRPLQSADYAGGLERYGTVVFWKYLSERFRSNDVIRQVWNAAAASSGNRNGIRAVGAVLAAKRYSFADEFARYGLWNTLPPGTYADRGLWPAAGGWASGTLTRSQRDTGVLSVKINHLAHAPLVVRADPGLPARSRLRVVIDGPLRSHQTRATVQVRLRSGGVRYYPVPLNAAGNTSRLYPFNPRYVKSVIVVMTNASTGYNAQVFKVRARAAY